MRLKLIFLMLAFASACHASEYSLCIEKGDRITKATAAAVGEHRLVAAAHAVDGYAEIFVDQEIGWLRCSVVKTDLDLDLVVLECKAAHFDATIGARPRNEVVIETSTKAQIVELREPEPVFEKPIEAMPRPADDLKVTPKNIAEKDDAGPDSEVEVSGKRAIQPGGFVLVEFGASWCGACKKNAPNIAAIEKDKGPFSEVHAIDVDANQELADQRGVKTIPCSIVYHNGKEVCRHFGVHTREEMLKWATDPKSAR